jgi:hypothetical protein
MTILSSTECAEKYTIKYHGDEVWIWRENLAIITIKADKWNELFTTFADYGDEIELEGIGKIEEIESTKQWVVSFDDWHGEGIVFYWVTLQYIASRYEK